MELVASYQLTYHHSRLRRTRCHSPYLPTLAQTVLLSPRSASDLQVVEWDPNPLSLTLYQPVILELCLASHPPRQHHFRLLEYLRESLGLEVSMARSASLKDKNSNISCSR